MASEFMGRTLPDTEHASKKAASKVLNMRICREDRTLWADGAPRGAEAGSPRRQAPQAASSAALEGFEQPVEGAVDLSGELPGDGARLGEELAEPLGDVLQPGRVPRLPLRLVDGEHDVSVRPRDRRHGGAVLEDPLADLLDGRLRRVIAGLGPAEEVDRLVAGDRLPEGVPREDRWGRGA